MWEWLMSEWAGLMGNTVSFLVGLSISAYSIWNSRRLRQAEVERELSKSYREIWSYLRSDPEYNGISDQARDLQKRPRTTKETHAVRLLVFHLKMAFAEFNAKAYQLPENTGADIRQFFSRPVPRDAWAEIKKYQDADFVAFVETYLAGKN